MDNHYKGRLGARGPGGYDPDDRKSIFKQFQQKGNLLSNRNYGLALNKSDRGLLTLKPSKTPGPADYKID